MNDVHALVVGLYISWGLIAVLRLLSSFNYTVVFQRTKYASVLVFKWISVLVPWLIIIPMLLGLLFELSVLIPIRCPVNESPYFFLYHNWVFGLLSLKLWFQAVMLDAYPNSWKAKFEKIKRDGIIGVDVVGIFHDLIIPITTLLLFLLSVPYTIVNGIFPLLCPSIYLQSLCYRFVYLGGGLVYVTYHFFKMILSWYPAFKQAIFDDKYLLGHQLHNREHS